MMSKLTSPQRDVDPEVVHQLQRTIKRLSHVIEEYEQSETPDSSIDFNITQAIQTLRIVKRNLVKH